MPSQKYYTPVNTIVSLQRNVVKFSLWKSDHLGDHLDLSQNSTASNNKTSTNWSALTFPREAMLAWYMLSSCFCPSIRLSHGSIVPKQVSKRRITQTTPYDSPWILVFWCQKPRQIPMGSHPIRAPNRGKVGSNWQVSTSISETVQVSDIDTMKH